MEMRQILRALAVVLLPSLAASWLVGIGGCGGSSSAPAPAELEVRVGYFANVTHAQAVLAVSSGELGQALAPAKLSTRVFNAGPELIAALHSGLIDVGYVGPGPVIAAYSVSGGRSLRVISGAAANGVVIVARPGSGIKTIADLAGHVVATPQQGNTQDVDARHFIKALGGSTDNILPVTNSAQAGLMVRGKIDAAWVPEPWGSRLMDQVAAVQVAQEKDLWPDHEFALTVVVATPEFIATHPAELEKILAVHRSWTERLRTTPQQYIRPLDDALFGLTKVRLGDDVIGNALKRTEFTNDPMPQTFATMAQWTKDAGFIRQVPDLSGLFVGPTTAAVAGLGAAGSATSASGG
jgi:NitT/TauT family transport system substrate-binding protein